MTEATFFFGVLGAFVAFVDDHKRGWASHRATVIRS